MKGLSSLERVILEAIGNKELNFAEVLNQSGLQENVCFNVLQALLIRGILKYSNSHYVFNDNLPASLMEEINGTDARKIETLELIEATLEKKGDKVFKFQKVALSMHDEKIFAAMLHNIEAFLRDAHKKSEKFIPLKERKVVFWGMSQMQTLLTQVIEGK